MLPPPSPPEDALANRVVSELLLGCGRGSYRDISRLPSRRHDGIDRMRVDLSIPLTWSLVAKTSKTEDVCDAYVTCLSSAAWYLVLLAVRV